jgi:hypothetical protein
MKFSPILLLLLVSTAVAAPIQWTHRTRGETAIAADHAGDLIVTGRGTDDPQAGNPEYYIYTAKHSGTDGHLLWEKSVPPTGGSYNDDARIVRVDSANNVLVASRHSSRIHLVKYSGSNGQLLWEGPAFDFFNTSDIAEMELDANNDVIVTGSTTAIASNRDVYDYFSTTKYSGTNGQVIWQRAFNGPGQPYDLAIDPSGHVIVAGYSRPPGSEGTSGPYDFYVTKYDAGDGHVWWEYRHPVLHHGWAYQVAADAGGNALVTGRIDYDTYTTKLAAADGSQLWTNRIGGIREEVAKDMVVDRNGNAIIAASHWGTDYFGSFYTAKYAGDDGRLLWERRNKGTGDYTAGEARTVKLGTDGTVYVSGNRGQVVHQIYTAAYAPDGVLLWEQRYLLPGFGNSAALHPMALLPNDDLAVLGLGQEGENRIPIMVRYTTASQLLNISTRMNVQTGDDALFAGFIVTGQSPKKILLRAIGPSLQFAGGLQDPVLELHTADGTTISNDNWKDNQEAEIKATSIPPPNDKESAIVALVPPGAHTAIVRGKNDGTGRGLIEVYDISAIEPATPSNISTRGRVGGGDDVMIGGFILRGPRPSTVLIRAIGPSLTSAGVPGALQDPTLELVDSNGLSITNDDWKRNAAGEADPAQQGRIERTGSAPKDDRESAVLVSLGAGPYTAIVRGKHNSIGVALIEAYNLE